MDDLDLSVRSCECMNCGGEDFPYLEEYYILRFGVEEALVNVFEGDWVSNIILREHYVEDKMKIVKESEHLYLVKVS